MEPLGNPGRFKSINCSTSGRDRTGWIGRYPSGLAHARELAWIQEGDLNKIIVNHMPAEIEKNLVELYKLLSVLSSRRLCAHELNHIQHCAQLLPWT